MFNKFLYIIILALNLLKDIKPKAILLITLMKLLFPLGKTIMIRIIKGIFNVW